MAAAVKEIKRVLRPGGEARIIVYNRHSLHNWFSQVLGNGILRGKLLKERSMAGVRSASVEVSSTDARPLVDVYSRKELGNMLGEIVVRVKMLDTRI